MKFSEPIQNWILTLLWVAIFDLKNWLKTEFYRQIFLEA